MNILFLIVALAITVVSIPYSFASEGLFYGSSSIEIAPDVLIPGTTYPIEIKFQYQEGPYSLSDFAPVFHVSPQEAAPHVTIEFESLDGIVLKSVKRINGSITVDNDIPSEKIFLNISYAGTYSVVPPVPYKSAWNDSLILSVEQKKVESADYEVIPWTDLKFNWASDAAIFTKNMSPLSILEKGEEYLVIHKADFGDDNFAKDSTFDAVVGYAYQKGDQIAHPPRGENVTDDDHQKFAEETRKLNDEFYQNSKIAKSFEFVADPEKPFFVKSFLTMEESGLYTHQYYKKLKFSPSVMSSNMGSLVVIDKFSKAVDESGVCIDENLRRLIKHDYSTLVCVDSDTAWKLIERGWGL